MKTRECLRAAVACCLLATVAFGANARNGDDPLHRYQWYLRNTGQAVFADQRPRRGIDLNMAALHAHGIRGKGIVVAVVDSGVDGEHEDLKANLVPGGSMDYEEGSRTARDVAGHGTAVAGIVAASGWNGVGGRGVAPEASLKSLNAYEVIDQSDPALNLRLTQRDVKYILARTARPVDPHQPRIRHKGVLVERGWVTNAAAYRFSNWYGFGLIDASAAVAMARGFRTLPAQIDSGWLAAHDRPARIHGHRATATKRIRVMQDMRIEAVQFSLGTSHGRPSQLLVTLTSPSGTVSHVLTAYTNLADQEDFSIPLSSSNAFFGESSRGVWTLSVMDLGGRSLDAHLRSFGLRVVGHRAARAWR